MRFNNYINEADREQDFEKIIKKLSRMTNDNDHTGALSVGLEFLGLSWEAGKARGLRTKIDRQGGYSPGDPIAKELHKLYQTMMGTAKGKLSSSDYRKFHGSF